MTQARTRGTFIFLAAVVATVLGSTVCLAMGAGGFVENLGQKDDAVRFYAESGGAAVYCTDGALVLDFVRQDGNTTRGHAVYVDFQSASPNPQIDARHPLSARLNFFLGNDPERWVRNAHAFQELVYRDLWPGVDLVVALSPRGIDYELVAAPGARLDDIGFDFRGVDAQEEIGPGSVRFETSAGFFPVRRGGRRSRQHRSR